MLNWLSYVYGFRKCAALLDLYIRAPLVSDLYLADLFVSQINMFVGQALKML